MSAGGIAGLAIGMLVLGLIAGFFGARAFFKKQLRDNPPINENMIRAMFRSMGRPCSEKQVRQIMKNVKDQAK